MIDAALRRELRAKANGLKSIMSVGKAGLSDAVVSAIGKLFEKNELIKVRMLMDSADDTELAGMEIAQRLQCEVVARTGRVLILYKPMED